MKELNQTAIKKLAEISEPEKAVTVSPEEAAFLDLETWDTEETIGEGGEDGN